LDENVEGERMQSSVRIDKNVTIEVRDGTKLRADIYRPDDNQKHPAIFIRTPYNKLRAAGSIGYIDVLAAAATRDDALPT
jgi:predicted acyl esterase